MPAKFLGSKILIGVFAAAFVVGGSYTLWREKNNNALPAEKTGDFQLVAEIPVAKKLASVIETANPAPAEQAKQPVAYPTAVSLLPAIAEKAPEKTPPPASQPENNGSVILGGSEGSQATGGDSAATFQNGKGPVIFEIQTGTESGGTEDEFVKLYNPTNSEIDLTGWALKKKTSSGNVQNLVSAGSFSGKIVAKGYFVIAHKNYKSALSVDLLYSANSNNLAYKNNSVVLYDAAQGIMDEVSWEEIPKDQIWRKSN